MAVLTPANAFPNLAFPQHGSGQTQVTSFTYPGAVWPKATGPAVLSWTNAFPNLAFPQHLTGQTNTVQDFLYPGAAQPIVPPAVSGFLVFSQQKIIIPLTGTASITVTLHNP